MKQIRSILLAYLCNNGFSNRTIAKATNVSRPVVAKYLGILAKHPLSLSQVMHTEEVFLAVLGASAYVFATPTYSQKQEDFANAMQDAFLFFGGVPRAVVPDCLKSAVIHNDGYEPVHNPLFKKLLDHYGTFSIPARPHHPKDKPFAENSVNLIYRQILARIDGKTFVNRDAMLIWWKKALAKINATPFQKLPGNRQDLFDKTDKLALQPLPEFLFDLSAIKFQTVSTTNTVYISEDKTYYSVPYALFGKKVDIHITPKQIHVWYENECRVTHERKFEAGKVILNEHLPADKNWFAGRNISEQIRSFAVNGKHVVLWAKKIEAISGHEDIAWNMLNGLSKIIKKYPARIDAVCRIALSKNLCSLKHLNESSHGCRIRVS